MHKSVFELRKNDQFLMAGGHYVITEPVKELSDPSMYRVRFQHMDAVVERTFTLDIATSTLFVTL